MKKVIALTLSLLVLLSSLTLTFAAKSARPIKPLPIEKPFPKGRILR